MSLLNKNTVPNILAVLVIALSFSLSGNAKVLVFNTGMFALSGALTNWIAVHMLFERVPGLYGSGIIPLHFEEFKRGILLLVTEQLFRKENVDAAFQADATGKVDLRPAIESLDLDDAYDQLKNVILESSFGAMLGMVGGGQALEPMRQPFKDKISVFLVNTTQSPRFQQVVAKQISSMAGSDQFMQKIRDLVESRLDELTPEMVRDIVQDMIRKHLGWLVVWGGLFGALIGMLSTLIVLNYQ